MVTIVGCRPACTGDKVGGARSTDFETAIEWRRAVVESNSLCRRVPMPRVRQMLENLPVQNEQRSCELRLLDAALNSLNCRICPVARIGERHAQEIQPGHS